MSHTINPATIAYITGYDAAMTGTGPLTNPYLPDTAEASGWDAGVSAALADWEAYGDSQDSDDDDDHQQAS